MKENHIGKLKSLLVAMIMIASVTVVFNLVEQVEAHPADLLEGEITNIRVASGGTGEYVSGVVNIIWDSTLSVNGSAAPVVYNVTFAREPDTDGLIWHHLGGNLSADGGNSTSYLWNTTTLNIPDGEWWVNVTAKIDEGDDEQWKNGTSIRLIVRNTMPGTPGIDIFQGGRYWLYNDSEAFSGHYNEIFTFSNGSMAYNDVTDITINSSLVWGGSDTNTKEYYLYKPMYNGSKGGDSYNLSWTRVSNTPGKYWITGDATSGYTTSGITLDRAGLWLVNEVPSGSNGMWIDDEVMNTIEQYNSTVWAWFWVNTSTNLQSEFPGTTSNEFYYNTSGYTTQVVTEGGNAVTGCTIDITNESSGVSVRTTAQYTSTGTFDTNGGWNLSKEDCNSTGNFSGRAYVDLDYVSASNGLQYYTEYCMGSTIAGWAHYNNTYGANAAKNGSSSTWSTATRYNWSICGPWDPPEQNATMVTLRVKTNTPYVSTTNGTMNYGFEGEINITLLEGSSGTAFDETDVIVEIFDDDNVNVTNKFSIWYETDDNSAHTLRDNVYGVAGSGLKSGGQIVVYKTKGYGGWLTINMTKWGQNASTAKIVEKFADNGTWKVKIHVDTGTDREISGGNKAWSEEWNTTVNFKVKQAPSSQWKWIDDDGSLWSDANYDEVIPYIPPIESVPINISFIIYDSAGGTFGDITETYDQESGICESIKQCAHNISFSGNSLFTGALDTFPSYTDAWFSGGTWTVPIIPTMSIGGGTITIQVNAYNATLTKTLSIGGENYWLNGSIITVDISEFQIDTNQTFLVSAAYADDGAELRSLGNAGVTLYYIDDNPNGFCQPIDYTQTTDAVSWTNLNVGGFFEIPFNTTQQTENQTLLTHCDWTEFKAPRNLTLFVDGPGKLDGYALIEMKPVNDLETHISHDTFMSGYEYDDVTLSCDFVGNSTDTPSTRADDKNKFYMKIFDEWGNDMTGTTGSLDSDDGRLYGIYNTVLTGGNAYSFEFDGVYGLDAGTYYLYAHNNTHTSEGNNATFEIKAVDVACDMDPFIWMSDDNISATFTITYGGEPVNGTLVIDNMTDSGSYNRTWTNCSFTGSSDAGGNSSLEVDDTLINNGVATVRDITANALHPNVAKQYITFWIKPAEAPGAFARASARITVEVPSVTPEPMYIPLGRTTKVYVTATGRGENLQNVYVRLHGQGFNGSSTTDVDGRVAFSVTPSTTGNISIDVGEINRTLADTVVKVVAWVIDGSTDSEVNEEDDFTVTVIKEGTTDTVVGATVKIVGIGTATTDANGEATFTAPEVTSDRTYTIKITAEGYAPDPDGLTITVINIPQLLLVIPDKVPATTTFDVAVADDTGGAIVGAMISFDGKTYTTGVNGIAKLSAPKEKGDYAIEASFGNYVPATDVVTVTAAEGIPGFELLTLIAALGVAFILLRRRKH